MKNIWYLFIAALMWISAAQAQEISPEKTVQMFENSLSLGDLSHAASFVENADERNPVLVEIEGRFDMEFARFQPSIRDIKIIPNAANSTLATATYSLVLADHVLDIGVVATENLPLKKLDNGAWRIVPYNPEKLTPVGAPDEDSADSDFLRRFATMLAYPTATQTRLHLDQSMRQMKQLALGVLLFAVNHDEKFDFEEKTYQKMISPYLKSDEFFTAPGDKEGTNSYSINPSILRLKLDDIKHPAETVLFYLGKEKKLDFRYNNLSPVCFVDGHVKAMTPAEAQNLRWEP